MREMAPIGEMAPGCAKKYKKEIFKTPFAPGAISRMITVFTNSAPHPSERWHRGCLAKP